MKHNNLAWPLIALTALLIACGGQDSATGTAAADMGPGDLSQDSAATEDLAEPEDLAELEDLAVDLLEDVTEDLVEPEDLAVDLVEDTGAEGDAGDLPQEDMGAAQEGPGAPGLWAWSEVSDVLSRADRQIPVVALVPQEVEAPAPLLVLSPGFQLEAARYRGLAEHLASHGFVVVLADPPASLFDVSHAAMALDIGAVLDWATDPSGDVGQAGDPERVGLLGHSLGGKVSFMVAAADPRVGAVLGLDPVNGGNPLTGYSQELPDVVPDPVSSITAPVGLIGETVNATSPLGQACAPEDQNFLTFLEASTSSAWAVAWEVQGADHMDFLDDDQGCLPCLACSPGSADPAEVLAATRAVATAFFRLHLRAEPDMQPWLTGEHVPTVMTATPRP